MKLLAAIGVIVILTCSWTTSVNAEEGDFAGGYRFKYYAVTHDGAPETYGGSGVIYISPERFGFDTHPQLRSSTSVKQLLRDRMNEHVLKKNGARVCMANLPAPGATAAFPLMHHALTLSRAWIEEDSISIPYISHGHAAFTWQFRADQNSIKGRGTGHKSYFSFNSDRLVLTPDSEIGLNECVAFAERHASDFNAIRDGSDALWDAHRARVEIDEFSRAYEERTSAEMKRALERVNLELEWKPEKGALWAMQALIYGNAVDFMALEPEEAREKAESALQKALELAPHSNLTHAAYGLVMRNRDTKNAELRLQQCITRQPEFPECHNLYGDLLRKTGRAEQAGDIYLEGLKRWPENGELHVSYALYLQETGRASEAIEYLRGLVANQPRFPRGHWHLAVMLYEEGGDLDEAREHAVKALEMDPKIWNGERLLLELLR